MYTALRLLSMTIALLCAFSFSLNAQSGLIRLATESILPLPPGWSAPDDTLSYPFRITHDSARAELILFKSEISKEESITSDFELRGSVQKVIDDVILTLPDARILTNSGHYDIERCGFVIEFMSTDSLSNVVLHHRISGIIYRLSHGSQVLFTLWGKAPDDRFSEVQNDFLMMQENFEFTGEHIADVYKHTQRSDMFLYGLLAIMLGLLTYFRRARSVLKIRKSVSDRDLWYCPCGTPNLGKTGACHACGSGKTESLVT